MLAFTIPWSFRDRKWLGLFTLFLNVFFFLFYCQTCLVLLSLRRCQFVGSFPFQGKLQMWVDIFPKEDGTPKRPVVIEERKPVK